jgi:hypothetical protein
MMLSAEDPDAYRVSGFLHLPYGSIKNSRAFRYRNSNAFIFAEIIIYALAIDSNLHTQNSVRI